MEILHQLFLLPFAFVWVPGGIFLVLVGGAYALTRRPAQIAESAGAGSESPPVLADTSISGSEKRVMFRRSGNPVELQLALPDDKTRPVVASLLDRSVGGMRIAMYDELAVGSIVVIRPVRSCEMVPWIELEVRSCRQSQDMPGQLEFGCQYVKVPPYSIQMLFG